MSKPVPAAKPAVVTNIVEQSRYDLRFLIRAMVRHQASDLHLRVGSAPLFRINGKLVAAKMEEVTQTRMDAIILPILSEAQRHKLDREKQIDFSFRSESLGRFRCNFFFQKGGLAGVVRSIPIRVPSLEQLGLPIQQLKEAMNKDRGLFFVTGATGSGKSTTLASIIQTINETQSRHILTVEDPIEFEFKDVKSAITQREVGQDVASFEAALYSGLRQDPDVIVVGELRDPKTILMALNAAETGHLVLTTLHTNDTKSAIDRILYSVPPEMVNQTRMQLASSLVGVITQQLLDRRDGSGRILVYEFLSNSPSIQEAIKSNQIERIPDLIQSSRDLYGMQTFNQHLEKLVESNTITLDEALSVSKSPDELMVRLSGAKREVGY